MILGHIAGLPLEETLVVLAPVGVVGIGALAVTARGRAARWWCTLMRRRPSADAALNGSATQSRSLDRAHRARMPST